MPYREDLLLDKLCSGCYSALGCEFNSNESIVWYIQKKVEEIHWSVHKVTTSAKVACIVCD